ncbi:hypothetical protein L210DRAFT_3591256, partial [Boletus edulis BED1]
GSMWLFLTPALNTTALPCLLLRFPQTHPADPGYIAQETALARMEQASQGRVLCHGYLDCAGNRRLRVRETLFLSS